MQIQGEETRVYSFRSTRYFDEQCEQVVCQLRPSQQVNIFSDYWRDFTKALLNRYS